MVNRDYQRCFNEFLSCIKPYIKSDIYPHSIEFMFESLNDWSQLHTLDSIKSWFLQKRNSSSLVVEDIAIKDMVDWNVDPVSGNISHASGGFFSVHGVHVISKKREVKKSWDQPILKQVGLDGGILGLIRKRINDVPHYLCQAKEEPGNYGKVQISPSLQATFSNIEQVHGGDKPYFSDLFLNAGSKSIDILFDSWLAEDGGRLFNKRNRGILIDVYSDIEIPTDDFIWLSLYQIKQLLKEDAWISPHIRGIISHA